MTSDVETAARSGTLRAALDAARAKLLPSPGPRSSDPGARRARSALIDAAIRGLATKLPEKGYCVLAVGGYGRRELAPRSDIDVLLLRGAGDAAPFEPLLRELWDAGLEVGSAVRSVDAAETALGTDLHAATATLQGRFLAGDRSLFLDLRSRIHEKFLPANALRFLRAKLDETSERQAKRGGTIFLLAPDLKEGRGMLRDLELARLIATLAPWLEVRAVQPLEQEASRPTTTPEDAVLDLEHADLALDRWLQLGEKQRHALERADALIAATRAAVHELEPVRAERLGKAVQEAIAERFGYRERGFRLRVENFLRDVYRAAKTIDRTLRLASDRVQRLAEPRRATRGSRVSSGVIAVGAEVFLEPRALDPDAKDPCAAASELFLIAQRTKRDVGLGARESVRKLLHAAAREELMRFRESPTVVKSFREVLAGATHVSATLRAMHDAGYLDELLPEFGALDCLAQADPYHAYTADEHTLAAVAALEGLPAAPDGGTPIAPAPPEREDRIREELLHRVGRRDLLRLGLLLHDAGKTGGSLGHVERGVALVPDVARRFGLERDEERHVRFLVEHHLTMSRLAETRDVDATETQDELLRACSGDPERLDHLFLLTCADVRAVSPRAFTRWKDTLLTRLYERARERAESSGAVARPAPRDDESLVRELEARVAPPLAAKDLREHLALCPSSYLVEVDPEDVLLHLELAAAARGTGLAFRVIEEDGFDRIYVATRDRPRLFASLCGGLAAEGINIVGAQAITRKDGVVLDRFAVVPEEGVHPPAEKWTEVERTLARVLAGELGPQQLIEARARRVPKTDSEAVPRRRPPVRVRLSNKISAAATIVDVTAPDRPGLLHDITSALSDLGLDIRLAKIATKGDRAVDVFYVTTTSGAKVEGAAALLKIRKAIAEAAK